MEREPVSICLCCSRNNYDLGYKLYREGVPYRSVSLNPRSSG